MKLGMHFGNSSPTQLKPEEIDFIVEAVVERALQLEMMREHAYL